MLPPSGPSAKNDVSDHNGVDDSPVLDGGGKSGLISADNFCSTQDASRISELENEVAALKEQLQKFGTCAGNNIEGSLTVAKNFEAASNSATLITTPATTAPFSNLEMIPLTPQILIAVSRRKLKLLLWLL